MTTATGLAVAPAFILGETALAAPPVALPVPCAAGSCVGNSTPGFTSPGGFVTAGKATATQTGNTLNVQQTSNQAILNWSSFNIGAGGVVNFQQPSSTAVALNKIYQNNPSSIFGSLNANGQIYLINPNGFVFGSGSKVNVAGLVASSLGLTGGDSEFAAGLLSQIAQTPRASALSSDNRVYVTDSSGNLVLDANGQPQPVQIAVQSGAQITASDGGRVLLAGQTVTNAGTVSAPDGQIALAAGQTIYLSPSADSALRGLVVEVSNNGTTATNLGTVTNQAGGTLSSARGNVSLMGLAVNQSGRISATTSVSYNGSVVLQAGQGGATGVAGVSCVGTEVVCTTQGGKLTIGSTSEIDVLPEYSDTSTAAVAQAQIQSQVNLTGQQVFIQGGQITAPGGNLDVLAASNPDQKLSAGYDPNAELRVAAGTAINLAGSDAIVPMSANLVSIQLNSNELEDDPSQRTGPLKGKTVIVDVRNGKPAIISESSWQSTLQGIQENVSQRTSAGGTASFRSLGDVVVNPGASINVSGGEWNYTGGVAQTSQLLGANGKSYEVSSADPNLAYQSVINPTYTQTYNGFGVQITNPTPGLAHYSQGYTQGFSAGSVTFAAPAMSLQGTLLGTAVNGAYQRSAAPAESLIGYLSTNGGNGSNTRSGGLALGGTLIIGDSTGASIAGSGYPNLFAPAVTFSSSASPVIVADGAALPPQPLQLTTSYITSGGFTQTHIFSDSVVTLPTGLPLNLGIGGDLEITAPRIDINSNITALGGRVSLLSEDTVFHQAVGSPRLGIDIGNGVTLDVSGQWTNDLPYASGTNVGAAYQNGGSISFGLTTPATILEPGGELVLGNGVSLDANGGAWLKANGSIAGGTGGSITLNAGTYESALQIGNNVGLSAFGVQGAIGGSFSLSAPVIEVSQGNGSWASSQRADWLPPVTTTMPGSGSSGTGSSTSDDPSTPVPKFNIGAGLFSKYGFSSVTLTATDPIEYGGSSTDLLTVAAGTAINAQAQSLQLLSGFQTRHSGGTIQGFTAPVLLPEAYRSPYTINLMAVAPTSDVPLDTVLSYGDLEIQAGSSITADPGSSIGLTSLGSILVDGVLRAPGGAITATINEIPKAANSDYGFLASQVLELGATGALDVSGTSILTPNTANLPIGKVLAGGTVTLTANRGALVTDSGSLIDVAGSSAYLDIQNLNGAGGYTAATMGSAGGTLSVTSGESISLLGTLLAAPGNSSAGTLEGGTLNVSLNQGLVGSNGVQPASVGYQSFPSLVPTIQLVSSTAGSGAGASYGNQAVLGITQLQQSGIDALTLQAISTGTTPSGTIAIDTNTPLSMGREISLDAPNISVGYGTVASLTAPYVSFTESQGGFTAPPAALGGTGSLDVTAAQIVLSGFTALQGVGNAAFTSTGDIELEPLNITPTGGLSVAGNLTLNAARVYPATYSSFTISDPLGNVTIGQTSASPGTPLSAGGSLTINATNIVSSGTVLAPFGSIALNGSSSVDLKSGSVTSVSADGASIPYGTTALNQGEWVIGGANYTSQLNGSPTGQVTLNSAKVSFDNGAKVDLSGGGDLSAYEWVPGTGGSVDALNQTAGLYAIVPSLGGNYASYDAQRFGATAANVGVGASIYLSGVGGLPAGTYTLLPATYALTMPNAYLVQVESGFTSLTAGTIGHLTNGTPVVAGYLTFGNTGLRAASGYQGFAIYPGNYGQTLAQYDVSNASHYFASAAATAAAAGKPHIGLPADAGTLLIQAGTSLSALGTVNSVAGTGGMAATIEITADDLMVTKNTTDTVAPGVVAISAPVLESWDAGNLVLGGQLLTDATTGAVSLDVTANTVTIAPGAQLSANQLIAVANNTIDLQPGAVLASTSGAGGAAPKSLPDSATIALTGTNANGVALLSVSDANLVLAGGYTINPGAGSSGSSTTAPPGGMIDIEAGAALNTRGAVSLNSSTGVTVDGSINGPGASWSLASKSIAFVPDSGTPSGAAADTLLINPTLLTQMQSAGAVQLSSAGSIDLLTNVSLGASAVGSAPSLTALTLSGSSINNCAGCSSVLGAHTLTLAGIGTATTATSGTGTLTLVANTLNLGGSAASGSNSSTSPTAPTGNLVLNGNSQTTVQVSGAVVGQGTNTSALSTVAFSGDVSIAAAELTAASGTGTAIAVGNGSLTLSQNGSADSAPSLAGSLGGQLSLTANTITDTGSIVIPGGTASLAATGNIALGSGATIDTRGITVSVGNQTEGAAGGAVNIVAGGDLSLASGATINVSGGGTAPAGSLALVGVGNVTADATFLGNPGTGATGGSFSLQAGSLAGGLSPAMVNNLTSGGFNNKIGIQVNSGDLDLGAGETLTANNITLTADTGAVNVGGTLTASAGGQSGFIGLYGGTGVSLLSGATLTANGIASSGHGGQIELSSTCLTCSVNLASGSAIVTNGGADGGELVIAAPVSGTNDVAINLGQQGLGANVSGVGKVIIEAMLPSFSETKATIGADLSSDVAAAANYLTGASPTISARLNPGGNPTTTVQAGVEIDDTNSKDTLVLPTLNLSAYSSPYAPANGTPQVIDLTVRAAGGLTIGGNITDGFDASNGLYTAGSDSATLRFVAGANLASANPLATAFVPLGSTGATLNVGTPGTKSKAAVVTTGTGNIELAAAGNVNFVAGSTVYTTGTLVAPAKDVGTGASSQTLNFAAGGGNVVVKAGQDVTGVLPSDDISVSYWEGRDATNNNGGFAEWGLNLTAWKLHPWEAATFGGGDVSVTAGRDIIKFTAATADSLYRTRDDDPTQTPTQTLVPGGGLAVTSARDVTSSEFFAADGIATISAGRSLATTPVSGAINPLGSAFWLQNAAMSVWAQDDITIAGAFNPTIAPSSAVVNFWTYGSGSAFSAQSTSGDVTYQGATALQESKWVQAVLGPTIGKVASNIQKNQLNITPPQLRLVSLTQDVSATATLYPAANGQLDLFAGKDLSGAVFMSDAPLNLVSTAQNVLQSGGVNFIGAGTGKVPQPYNFFADLHSNDPEPAIVAAGEDISNMKLSIPKAAQIEAGRDIVNLVYNGQNLNPSDVTLISAGRDFIDPATYSANGNPVVSLGIVQVGGPGSLTLLAGRDIDLGLSSGITTVGNLRNSNLPTSAGANITMVAGLGNSLNNSPDYNTFYQRIIEPSAIYQQELVSYVESITGQSDLSTTQADSEFFAELSPAQQQSLIDSVFFSELNLSGIEANKGIGYGRGYTAIDALFPGSRTGSSGGADGTFKGDLNLTYSQIYTESGGGISLLAPGGSINVGLAVPPALGNPKQPSELGIVAEGSGDVDIYSKGDVNVDSSRIFTLGGGNILIWSDEGNIDAGKGSKTSLSAPPPTYSIDSHGNVVTTFGAAVAGSGIRTIQTNPSEAAGNVNLIAPAGFVNAGEAGIGAAGSVNIAALAVLNAANISYGTTATGVPPSVSGITASLASAASAASSATSSVTNSMEGGAAKEEAAPASQAALSWLDVFVSGLGEENCKPEDTECLKRQKQE